MATAPMFTVVVPTYARPGLLAEAVDSVLRQSEPDLECLVVDDAGPTPAAVPDDPRVRLVRRDTNGGLAAARNTGIRAARGRYVTFLDDDDVLAPDRLRRGAEGLSRSPVSVCWVGYLDRPGDGGRGRVLEGDVRDVILDATTPNVGAALVSRDVLPLFDESYRAIEDVEWWLRLAQAAPFTTVPYAGYLFRRHDGVRHGNGTEARVAHRLRMLRERADYFDAHPRAAAFQWKRLGLTAQEIGRHREARVAFRRSLRTRPHLDVVLHLGRSLRPDAAVAAP